MRERLNVSSTNPFTRAIRLVLLRKAYHVTNFISLFTQYGEVEHILKVGVSEKVVVLFTEIRHKMVGPLITFL